MTVIARSREHDAERRMYRRWMAVDNGKLTAGKAVFDCSVLDFSAGGARLATAARLHPESEVVFSMRGLPPVPATIVRAERQGLALRFNDAPLYVFR